MKKGGAQESEEHHKSCANLQMIEKRRCKIIGILAGVKTPWKEEAMTWFGIKMLHFLKATSMKIHSKILITMNDSVTISLKKHKTDAQKKSNVLFANEAKSFETRYTKIDFASAIMAIG